MLLRTVSPLLMCEHNVLYSWKEIREMTRGEVNVECPDWAILYYVLMDIRPDVVKLFTGE